MSTLSAKSPLPAVVGAILATIGASVCCVVPLVLVLLGVSGAWIANLTALDAWRPWFTGVALLCLALAFWTFYRPGVSCRTNGDCVNPRVLQRRRRWLWLATVSITLLLLFPYYVVWIL